MKVFSVCLVLLPIVVKCSLSRSRLPTLIHLYTFLSFSSKMEHLQALCFQEQKISCYVNKDNSRGGLPFFQRLSRRLTDLKHSYTISLLATVSTAEHRLTTGWAHVQNKDTIARGWVRFCLHDTVSYCSSQMPNRLRTVSLGVGMHTPSLQVSAVHKFASRLQGRPSATILINQLQSQ